MLITSIHLTMEVFSIHHTSSSGIKTLLYYKHFLKLPLKRESNWHLQNMALPYLTCSSAMDYHATYCSHNLVPLEKALNIRFI